MDDSQFKGTLQANGYRFITLKYLDVISLPNWELYGDGPFELDFTGSAPYRNEFWVTLDNTTGDVIINTGRIDTLCGMEFDNTVTVYITGKMLGEIDLLGAGTVKANELEHGGISQDNFTGTLEYGGGMVVERRVYSEMACNIMSFVAFANQGDFVINQGGVVQDVGTIDFTGSLGI